MIVSKEWLKDFINVSDVEDAKIAETLTSLGLEVEEIVCIPAIDDLVVVGKVLKTNTHTKRLTLCEVDTGERKGQVICGAPNVKTGMTVAVALPEATIKGQKIGEATIRGVLSQGMICSELELNLGDEHDGILPLNDELEIGTKVNTIFRVADTIFTINVTPNRGDCLSYLGIARELSAKLGLELTLPRLSETEVSLPSATDKTKIVLAEDCGCQRFCAWHAQITEVSTSPFWLRRRLQVSGIRPVNAIVDITNYVMLEHGQPLHAYDVRAVRGGVIEVRRAGKNDRTFVSLDGKERQLQTDDILICDNERVIGLAGIMGGENSEITAETREIVFEVAHFNALSIRKTARRLGINSEASHRFAREVDIAQLPRVAERARSLLAECLPASTLQAVSTTIDDLLPTYSNSIHEEKVALRLSRTRKILGLPALTGKGCAQILQSLACELIDKTEDRLLVKIPSFRHDLRREIDLIEEIGRFHGLGRIPYELPLVRQSAGIDDSFVTFQTKTKVSFANLGFRETINFAMGAVQDYHKLGIKEEHPLFPSLVLQNPINDQLQVMQTLLLPNLLRCVKENHNHQMSGTRLFEVGRRYLRAKFVPANERFSHLTEQGVHLRDNADEERPFEHNIAAAVLDAPYRFKGWQTAEVMPDVYLAKRLVCAFLANFGLTSHEIEIEPAQENELPFCNPYASLHLHNDGDYLGYITELHPAILAEHKLDGKLIYFELLLDKIFIKSQKRTQIRDFIDKYPAVHRDLAFLFPRGRAYKEIRETLEKFPQKNYLRNFRLFDIFSDPSIGEDCKSMAFSFSFRSKEKTLTDVEVDGEVANLVTWMTQELNAKLR